MIRIFSPYLMLSFVGYVAWQGAPQWQQVLATLMLASVAFGIFATRLTLKALARHIGQTEAHRIREIAEAATDLFLGRS